MINDINLLTSQDRKDKTKLLRRLRLLRFVAIGFLSLVGFASVVLFILIAASPLPDLKKKESSSLATLATLHQKLGTHLLILNQIQDVSSLLQTRPHYDEKLDTLTALFPKSFILIGYSFTSTDASLNLAAGSVEDIEAFLQKIRTLIDQKTTYSQATISSINFDTTSGKYFFTVGLKVK